MKKTLKAVLAVLLAASAAVSVAACGGNGGDVLSGGASEPSAAGTSDVSETSGTSGRYKANVPDKNLGGEEIVFLTRDSDHGVFATWDFSENEKNPESINAALKQRNDYIMSTYNVTFKEIKTGGAHNGGEMYDLIYAEMIAQTGAYDVAYCGISDATTLAASGCFYDLSELPYIDLTAEWWDSDALKNLSIANRSFFAVGDISVQLYETLPCLVYNKSMIKSLGLEDPAAAVENGTWTLDKLYEIAKRVYTDTDGDGVPSVGDTFGVGGQNDNMNNFFYGSGCRAVTLDTNGYPTLTYVTDRSTAVAGQVFDLMTDKSAFFNCNDYASVPGWTESPIEFVTNAFKEGRLLFYSDGLLHLDELSEVSFDFGLLPVPKYDTDQESYYHLIGAWGATVVTIPRSCSKPEDTALIIEAMAAESKNTVSPAYFERVLALQRIHDETSEKMLDIILGTKSIDVAFAYNWGDLQSCLMDMLTMGSMSFVSNCEAKQSAIEIAMQQTILSYGDLPHYTGSGE